MEHVVLQLIIKELLVLGVQIGVEAKNLVFPSRCKENLDCVRFGCICQNHTCVCQEKLKNSIPEAFSTHSQAHEEIP